MLFWAFMRCWYARNDWISLKVSPAFINPTSESAKSVLTPAIFA